MSVDYCKLNDDLRKKGLKKSYIAQKLNLSEPSLSRRLNGINEWRVSEVEKLSNLLGYDSCTRDSIFFKKESE